MSAKKLLNLVVAFQFVALLVFSGGCSSTAIKNRTQKVAFQIGETEIHAEVTERGKSRLTMVNLHEDEKTSVQAGQIILQKYGGRLIRLVHSGQRRVVFSLNGKQYSFDPNRIFSDPGVRKTLESRGAIPEEAYKTVNQFAVRFIHYFALDKGRGIITLHNNGEGDLSIHTYEPGGEEADVTDQLSINLEADPDDFFYVTSPRFFEEAKKRRFNAVLQHNQLLRDDGSLSIFAGQHAISYINVEAQSGHFREQVRMLDFAVKRMMK